jgi:predicted DNA-binding transcriptional regulator AlpA
MPNLRSSQLLTLDLFTPQEGKANSACPPEGDVPPPDAQAPEVRPATVKRNSAPAADDGEPPEVGRRQRERREVRRLGRKAQRNASPIQPQTVAAHAVSPQYLSVRELSARFNVGVATIWRWAAAGGVFPKPVQLSAGTTRWRLSEVQAFEEQLGGRR